MRFFWLPLALTGILLAGPHFMSWAEPAFVNGLTIVGDTIDANRNPGANAGRLGVRDASHPRTPGQRYDKLCGGSRHGPQRWAAG